MTNKHGINPVTIRPKMANQSALCISRIQIGSRSSPELDKLLTVMIIDEQTHDVAGITTVDEDDFRNALGHLFPHGELAQAHIADPQQGTQRVGPQSPSIVRAGSFELNRGPKQSTYFSVSAEDTKQHLCWVGWIDQTRPAATLIEQLNDLPQSFWDDRDDSWRTATDFVEAFESKGAGDDEAD